MPTYLNPFCNRDIRRPRVERIYSAVFGLLTLTSRRQIEQIMCNETSLISGNFQPLFPVFYGVGE